MEKFWEENSNLSTEEIDNKFTGKTAAVLKVQKENKNKVMRLSTKEDKLINLIRDTNIDILLELRTAFNDSSNKKNLLNLKRIISILEDRTLFDISSCG